MGIVYRNGDFNLLATKIRHIPDQMLDDLEPLMQRTAKTGAELMEGFIKTRGTVKSGKKGRIETGEMLDNVDSEIFRQGNTITARWGWLNKWEDYFRYQEQGFTNTWSREDVEPMHALFDSFMQNRELFFAEMGKKFRRRR